MTTCGPLCGLLRGEAEFLIPLPEILGRIWAAVRGFVNGTLSSADGSTEDAGNAG